MPSSIVNAASSVVGVADKIVSAFSTGAKHDPRAGGPVEFDRSAAIEKMQTEVLDVLVVGGGITGVSVALDAALRGLKVGLVEADDFASGTSSASSKMIHGGIRYIEQGDLRLVAHSLKERQGLYERAPHLVSRLPFMFPVYTDHGVFSPAMAKGFEGLLWVYDALGGWRIRKLHRRLTPAETLTHCPYLNPNGLEGGILYYDTRTDDARLTLAIGRTARKHGALLVNHAALKSIDEIAERPEAGGEPSIQVAHVLVDNQDGSLEDIEVRAKVIVNAAGVWSDEVDLMADPNYKPRLKPAKGVHVVVPWDKVRSQSTLVFPMITDARGKGGTGFVVRWGDYCYVGTTDTPYEGSYRNPRCTRQEAEELLGSLNAALTTEVTVGDITGSWAGLRPLLDTGTGATSEVSRTHEITEDDGTVTVAGGKLTISRHMAEQAVDRVCAKLHNTRRCVTSKTPIVGGEGFDAEAVEATGGRFGHLAGRYGTEARFVEDLAMANPKMAEQMMPGLPYLWAEALFAIRYEMARTVTDVLRRRIPARFLNSQQAADIAPQVADLLHSELGIPNEVLAQQVADFTADVAAEKAEFASASF